MVRTWDLVGTTISIVDRIVDAWVLGLDDIVSTVFSCKKASGNQLTE